MKAILEKAPKTSNRSFEVENVKLPHFISPYHFHDETEIILIKKSTGTLFAGDKMMKFKPGALAIIGTGLPHAWINDKEYLEPDSGLEARSIVFKFKEDMLGFDFMNLPEAIKIKELINNTNRGMIFNGWTQKMLSKKISNLSNESGFNRILSFLSILDTMSRSKEFEYLASEGFTNKSNQVDCERIDRVYQFVMNNFHRPIELKELSELTNMCDTAFCRYFKSRTMKNFTQFLNEIRIGHACKLLIERKYTPLEICYKSGYNYPSNFYKQFKKIMNITPLDYQKKYWEE